MSYKDHTHAPRKNHSRVQRVQKQELLHRQEQAPAPRARRVEEVLPALQRAQAPQGNEVMAVEVVERKSFPGRVVQFYHEVQDEMRKVTWPDRAQLKDTTIKIIIFVLFIGAVIGLIDLALQLILVQGIPSLFSRQ